MTKKDVKQTEKQCKEDTKEERMEKFEKTQKPDTATDVYYKTDCKLEDSKVAIPTEDAVLEAKEWVDDKNKR